MTWAELALAVAAIAVAAFVKGAVGFGFPLLATPLLALFLDVPLVISLLIVPNILMDGVQALRGSGRRAAWARHRWLIASGTAGMFIGTGILSYLPSTRLELILGIVILAFVVLNLNARRGAWRVPPARERWLSPVVGAIAGLIGGLTNTPGLPLVLYFYALDLGREEFVQSIALSFVAYKLSQLVAISLFGLLTPGVLAASIGVAVLALGAFKAGRMVQARLDTDRFNRIVLRFLALIGLWLITRSLLPR